MMSEQNLTNKNLKDIWTVDIGKIQKRVLPWYCPENAKVQCLEHPYGVSGPRDLEKVTRAVWYPSERLFDAAVVPNVV